MLSSILALIYLGITVTGGIMAAIGQDQKNKADLAKLQTQSPVYDAQAAALQLQLTNIAAQEEAAKNLAAINEAQIKQVADINTQEIAARAALDIRQGVVQGVETARAGSQAVGSVVARAGAGNVGGASVLRQAQAIETATSQRVGLVNAGLENTRLTAGLETTRVTTGAAADVQRQELQLSGTLGNLSVQEAGVKADLLQVQVNSVNNLADQQFLEKYGWMSVAAVALGAAAQTINQAAQTDWSKLSAPTTSIATENYLTQQPYDYSYGGNLNLGGY
jgi:hypothetical protein